MSRPSSWLRPVWTLVGLLVAYYAFPLTLADASPWGLVIKISGTFVGLVLVGSVMVKELGYLRRGSPGRGARVVALLLVLLVMGFSLAFFLVNQADADQIDGLQTRTDALYFTLSTMTTVGFGDVHAEGQLARALVCVLLVFNVVVVASLIRLYTTARDRRGDARV